VYQLSFFGALGVGSALWGWVGTRLGVPVALILCGATGAITAVAVRPWRLSVFAPDMARAWTKKLLEIPLPRPRDPAPTLTGLLHSDSGRVLEAVYYRVDPTDRDAFLTTMRQVRQVRLRAGALVWRLYEPAFVR
jgi:hypothetical protein